jgi:hypothetical protein
VLKPGGKIILFQDLVTELYAKDKTDKALIDSFEFYHQALINNIKQTDMEILAGEEEDIEICNAESLFDIKSRVPDLELESRPFPLVMFWDKGNFRIPVTTNALKRTSITKEEMLERMDKLGQKIQQEGVFNELNAKAGDLISFITMRFLVCQKPIPS